MGCGHSKINIYPRKAKNRSNPKKTVAPEKADTDEEEGVENDADANEKLEDCEQRKTIKVKPFGGALLAQAEISSSQQNFFKMLDEKIENGPDYDSTSESEKAAENARLRSLLKDWETASAGSRSLPPTPRRPAKPIERLRGAEAVRSTDYRPTGMHHENPRQERGYSQLTQSVIHQSYGVAQSPYRHPASYNPAPPPPQANYSALQYQALSPMYTSQPTYPVPAKQYPVYNQHGSPIKAVYSNSNPKPQQYIQYEQQQYSPNHKPYGMPAPKMASGYMPGASYTNGELIIQQQIYNQQMQYQQTREYQQYKQTREQMLLQRNYPTGGVHIPMVLQTPQTELSPLHRKQYELT